MMIFFVCELQAPVLTKAAIHPEKEVARALLMMVVALYGVMMMALLTQNNLIVWSIGVFIPAMEQRYLTQGRQEGHVNVMI